ncbi:MAG: hypothetical protein A2X46_05130 [Lentisphaerae bacterium GWF2_57_35]|nr:MAG: hypothetical protein A2X46_05130 [Lentisphaerae bacterium GWF2_57_35]
MKVSPCKSCSGASERPVFDRFEFLEEAPVALKSKAGEIVGSSVDLLHEGYFRVNQSRGLQYPMYLVCTTVRVRNMFENCLGDHGIKCLVCKGNVVSIANDLSVRAERNIGFDTADLRMIE